MHSVFILVLAILTTESSYVGETERPATDVADTIQFWLTPDTGWRIRTHAIDHDVHTYALDPGGNGSRFGADEAAAHIRKHYDGIIARSIVLEFPDPNDREQVRDILSNHRLSGTLEVGSGVAFYNPDRGEYRTKSSPKASVESANTKAVRSAFAPLPAGSVQLMDRQRAYVASLIARHFPGQSLTRTEADFAVFQQIVDAGLIAKERTWELQALGVVFGDALVGTIPLLAWWEVTDEYGTDPTLRYGTTTLQLNALTMISKRVEDGRDVSIAWMVEWIRAFIKDRAREYQ
jgi:hypothetical protein